MTHPDVIMSVWDDPRNVETLTSMWRDGKSASVIAGALGVTRNAVIGKVTRLKLPKHGRNDPVRSDRGARGTAPLITGRKGRSGNPGVPSVMTIKHRAEGRANIKPPREIIDEGVDVTSLIAFSDRKINQQCSWIPGDPLNGAMCCGKPVVEGHQWCPEHYARVYPTKGALA